MYKYVALVASTTRSSQVVDYKRSFDYFRKMALAVYLILTVALHAATSCCSCESGTNGESVAIMYT